MEMAQFSSNRVTLFSTLSPYVTTCHHMSQYVTMPNGIIPEVWSHCDDDSVTPPLRGWKIPWDGAVEASQRRKEDVGVDRSSAIMGVLGTTLVLTLTFLRRVEAKNNVSPLTKIQKSFFGSPESTVPYGAQCPSNAHLYPYAAGLHKATVGARKTCELNRKLPGPGTHHTQDTQDTQDTSRYHNTR